jgi:rhodanese-related sulfurtransferase
MPERLSSQMHRTARATLLAATLCLSAPAALAEFAGEWSHETALENMKSPDVVVVDVRSPEEYAQGHVPGAINIPHNKIDEHTQVLAQLQGKQILLYCRSGRRAGLAEETLTGKGFENLYHLKGDMQGWQNANLPVEK